MISIRTKKGKEKRGKDKKREGDGLSLTLFRMCNKGAVQQQIITFSLSLLRIFAEKLLVIQNEISQAHNSKFPSSSPYIKSFHLHTLCLDTHQHYKDGLLLLESIRQKTIDHGQLFREYQTQVTDRQFTLEIRHAEEEYLVSDMMTVSCHDYWSLFFSLLSRPSEMKCGKSYLQYWKKSDGN